MTLALERPELKNDSKDGWPSLVDMKVIVPGLVHYEDLKNSHGESVGGNVLVQKNALDRMAASIEGKPIVNFDHRAVSPKEYSKGKFQGIITGPAVFNAADGWYHAKGYVWDDATRRNIENGYSISCAYTVSEWGEGGTHNQVPYASEVLNGNYTHIAVVSSPRYEGARIELLNSKGGPMGIMNLFRKDKTEEKIEIDLENTKVPLGEGKGDASLKDLVERFNSMEPKTIVVGDDDLIEVRPGVKKTVKEIKNAVLGLMNQEESVKMENAHKAGEHQNALTNCAMCNSAAEDKDKEEKKNAADAEEKKRKDDDEKKNSVAKADKEAREKEAARLDELRNKGSKVEMPKITTLKDLQAEGEARYGVPPLSVAK